MADRRGLRALITHLDNGVDELVSSGVATRLESALAALDDTNVAAAAARLRSAISHTRTDGRIRPVSIDSIYDDVQRLRKELMCSYTRGDAPKRTEYGKQ